MVFEHPFHNRYTFASAAGTTHLRTSPGDPSTRSLPQLSLPSTIFPSDPMKFGCILFQYPHCDGSGWGGRCYDFTYGTTYTRAKSSLQL
ncbi:hypothetical protein BKA70DRAFT_1300248, partial [Coprinopsis sp. MPI-PUGE-AT-0042]